MFKLSDYFQPLNLINILYVLLALIFFDVLGTFVKSFFIKNKKIDTETRLINWLIGLGFFVFTWFIFGYLVFPGQLSILYSLVILTGISLPYYLLNKSYFPFLKFIKSLGWPILLVLPLLIPTFVKASLPPYAWDEMAYHFVSPYDLLHNISQYWQYNGNIYMNLPRLMDTLYVLSFSVTHTYSVVRFIQFSIFITSIFTAYLLVSKFINRTAAFLFVLVFLSLPMAIPTLTTTGYVDIVALSFLLLGLTFGITFLFSDIPDHLILSVLFWAMSIGTKYTTLTAFISFLISLSIAYWIKNKTFKIIFNKYNIFNIILVFITFGGYWYIKNFILYGNPIYPFFFQCWGSFAQNCRTGSSFFEWTEPVNINTLYSIIGKLLPQNIFLRISLILSPFLVILFGDKNNKLILFTLLLSLTLDFFSMKYFSGFDGRYQQYLICFLILLIALSISIRYKLLAAKIFQRVVLIFVILSCSLFYLWNVVLYLNSHRYLNPFEVRYALGKENIYTWINKILPDVSDAIVWCENPPNGPIAIANIDPDIIWFNYSGMMRSYLGGCYYGNPVEPEEWRNFIQIAKERKLKFWSVSVNRCLKNEDKLLEKKLSGRVLQLSQLNNVVICNSHEVVHNLYYFDYEKLK
jgi:hypothetical protein